MPIYFGSDNKIYDSDLDGSTSYAGNTSDFTPISKYDYKKILNTFSNSGRKVVYDQGVTGFKTLSKNFIFSDSEKVQNFRNILNNFIDKKITFLGYDTNNLNSDSYPVANSGDVASLLKWKNNTKKEMTKRIDDFVSGITDSLPTLPEFIDNLNDSYNSLAAFNSNFFIGEDVIQNQNIDLLYSVIDQSGESCKNYDNVFFNSITQEPKIAKTNLNNVYEYCIPKNYTFTSEYFLDRKNLSTTEFSEKYFNGGTSSNLGSPVIRLYDKKDNREVYIGIAPNDLYDNSKGLTSIASGVTDTNGLIDLYEKVREKNGLTSSNCASSNVTEQDLYDPATNKCGVISYCCSCVGISNFNGETREVISRPKLIENSGLFDPCEYVDDGGGLGDFIEETYDDVYDNIQEEDWPFSGENSSPTLSPRPKLQTTVTDIFLDNTQEIDGQDTLNEMDCWKSDEYPGFLTKCMTSDNSLFDGCPVYWHGSSGNSGGVGAYACVKVSGKEEQITNSYTINHCEVIDLSGDHPDGATTYGLDPREFPNAPWYLPYAKICRTTTIEFSTIVLSGCSVETSCECGCNPSCCLCLCASNHDDDFMPEIPRCTGASCDYESREIDIVLPTLEADQTPNINDFV